MGGIHKILHPLGDSGVLQTVLSQFAKAESIAEAVIVCRAQDREEFDQAVRELPGLPFPVSAVNGGATRQESVKNGVSAVSERCAYIAVHDGARPLVAPEDIERVIADARRTGAATLGVPVKDTIKTVVNGVITDTPERSLLWQTQTPQVFRRSLYLDAMARAAAEGKDYTDDCQLVEALGAQVTMTEGSYRNIKLTTPEDFLIAEAFLRAAKGEDPNA